MAKILFFGRLRELAGVSTHILRFEAPLSLAELYVRLGESDQDLAQALMAPSIRIAINAEMAPKGANPMLHPGDEIAFMPPFSGG